MCMQGGRHFFQGQCEVNLTSTSGHIDDSNEFILGIYIDRLVSHLHINVFTYMPYMWYLRGILVVDGCVAITWKMKVAVTCLL